MMSLIETKRTEMKICDFWHPRAMLGKYHISFAYCLSVCLCVLNVSGWSKPQFENDFELLIFLPLSDGWDYKYVPLRLVSMVLMTEPGASCILSKHSIQLSQIPSLILE